MSQSLSRRGLFSAFRPEGGEAAPQALTARVAAACLEEQGVGCRRCPELCDADAISFGPLGRGRARPVVSAQDCTGCGACAPACPVSALSLIPQERAALAAGFADLTRGACA